VPFVASFLCCYTRQSKLAEAVSQLAWGGGGRSISNFSKCRILVWHV
jgi:hypothetical protein